MKKKLSILMLACLIVVSYTYAQNKETRNVGNFTKIAFRIPGKLYLRQGNTQKVELEGSREVLSKVETEVEGSKLVIEMPGKWNWRDNDEKITVYVTVKDLQGASVGGSGDIIGETKFSTGDLDLNVSGSGSLKIEVDAKGEVDADVSGSGELNVSGSAKSFNSDVSGSGRVVMNMDLSGRADLGVSGSGKIEARGRAQESVTAISGSGRVLGADFEVARCEVRISGSGNVEVNVKEELDANISGSGSVRYKGNPSKVNSASAGSGRVSKM
jgi:hypothetical protein